MEWIHESLPYRISDRMEELQPDVVIALLKSSYLSTRIIAEKDSANGWWLLWSTILAFVIRIFISVHAMRMDSMSSSALYKGT
ncbi:putative N-acetyltransferase [Paenibacillus sp. 598K]|nr:putative N-acetyltransferase [Paenibacillus sp. 598K]